MKAVPREVLSAARKQYGLVTVDQLTAARVIGRARSAALESGMLVPVHRGVYRMGGHVESFEQRCVAACLAAPDAAIGGPTAGRLIGLRKMTTDHIHLVSSRTVRLRGVTAHRTNWLSVADVEVRGPLRLLRPLRLACDLAWHLSDDDLESVLEQMLDRRMFTVHQLSAASKRFAAMGRPGCERLRRVVQARPALLRPVQSDVELRLHRALAIAGLNMIRQYPLELDDGSAVRLDLADPARRLAIEVDHTTWHGGRRDVESDKRRDRQLARMGWLTVRVTDVDVDRRLSMITGDIVVIARQRMPFSTDSEPFRRAR